MNSRIGNVFLILSLLAAPLPAADAPWMEGTYYQAGITDQPVAVVDLLNDFSRAQGVPLLVSEDVTGLVSVQYPEMSPLEYLDRLTLDNGLIWYYDGAAIHVYTSDELQTVVMPLGDVDTTELVAALKRLGVYSERFPITAEPDYGLLYVVGPTRYIEVIRQISAGARQRELQKANIQVDVRRYQLQYAWADDQTFIIGDNQVIVPGVATILRSLLGNDPNAVSGRQVTQIPYNLPSLQGGGLIRPQNQIYANVQQSAMEAQIAARQAQAQAEATTQAQQAFSAELTARQVADQGDGVDQAGYDSESATQLQAEQQMEAQVQTIIQADSRTNSVVIRDVKERLDSYDRIIEDLDQPSGLVEIKATIVDLDADQSFQLGMPYHAMWNDGGQEQTLRTKIDTTDLANLTVDPGNFTISLLDDQVTRFFLNLQALELDGHARLVSKPSVVTINHIEAYLEEIEEFYVRVSGFEQVDLFNIKVGTKLYVVPHIICGPEGRQIKLTVRIEDGTRSDTAAVDEIPVVSRNIVNTHAVLSEGQSLLIGGLVREEESKTVQGLPLLSRLPKIGALFRETKHETKRVERLVLLTPTVIDLPDYGHPCHCQDDVQRAIHDSTAPQESRDSGPLPALPPPEPMSMTPLPRPIPPTRDRQTGRVTLENSDPRGTAEQPIAPAAEYNRRQPLPPDRQTIIDPRQAYRPVAGSRPRTTTSTTETPAVNSKRIRRPDVVQQAGGELSPP